MSRTPRAGYSHRAYHLVRTRVSQPVGRCRQGPANGQAGQPRAGQCVAWAHPASSSRSTLIVHHGTRSTGGLHEASESATSPLSCTRHPCVDCCPLCIYWSGAMHWARLWCRGVSGRNELYQPSPRVATRVRRRSRTIRTRPRPKRGGRDEREIPRAEYIGIRPARSFLFSRNPQDLFVCQIDTVEYSIDVPSMWL